MHSGRINWREYALRLAEVASLRSEDPYVKVGACAMRKDNSVAGLGYNGAPPGINIDWSNRDERRKRVIHAEINALRYVSPGECSFLAVTLLPCNDCLKTIASYGVKDIIFRDFYDKDDSSLDLSLEFDINLFHVK